MLIHGEGAVLSVWIPQCTCNWVSLFTHQVAKSRMSAKEPQTRMLSKRKEGMELGILL